MQEWIKTIRETVAPSPHFFFFFINPQGSSQKAEHREIRQSQIFMDNCFRHITLYSLCCFRSKKHWTLIKEVWGIEEGVEELETSYPNRSLYYTSVFSGPGKKGFLPGKRRQDQSYGAAPTVQEALAGSQDRCGLNPAASLPPRSAKDQGLGVRNTGPALLRNDTVPSFASQFRGEEERDSLV